MTQTMRKAAMFLLAVILTFTLAFTTAPLAAHAAGEWTVGDATEFADAITYCEDGDVIRLSNDITYSSNASSPAITIQDKSITIDVGDHVLDVNYTGSNYAVMVINGTLTLQRTSGAFNLTAISNAVNVSNGSATFSTVTTTSLGTNCISGNNSTITVGGDVSGYVSVNNCTVSTGNITNGRVSLSGTSGSVTVNGDVQGEYGVSNQSTGGIITVYGDVTASGSGSVGATADAGQIMVTGSVQGGSDGVVAVNGGIATTGSATATGSSGTGAYATNGGVVHVTGDVQGATYGASLTGSGSRITVSGDATATGSSGEGASAQSGIITIGGAATGPQCGISVQSNGKVSAASATGTGANGTGITTISGQANVSGEARGVAYGIQSIGGSTSADTATATGSSSTGVFVNGGTVTLTHTASGVRYGINTRGGTLTAGGATATGATGTGAAIEGGSATINGDVQGDTGVWSIGSVRVNGRINASSIYIQIASATKTMMDGVDQTGADLGYKKYTDASFPSASVLALSPVITINTQPAVSTSFTEGSISGSLSCDAGVAPDGTLTYQWYKCDDTSRTNPVTTGVSGKSFTIPTTLTNGTYYYFCKVSSAVDTYKDSDAATITVQALSHDASLSSLSISSGTLNPAFAQDHYAYTVSVPYSVNRVTVTPTVHETHAAVTVNGTPVSSGAVSGDISLSIGSNPISVSITAQDGSATQTYTIAVTRAERAYIVEYNINGGDGGSTASSTHTYGVAKNLTTNGYTRTGWHFAGWATTQTGAVAYIDGQSVTNLSSTDGATFRLYAVWIQNACTVSFDTGSEGPSVPPINTTEGGTITTPPEPTRTGYAFCGWYSDAGCTVPAAFPYTVTENATLHARWVATDFITDIIINGGTLTPSFDPGIKKYTVTLDENTSAFTVDAAKANPNNKVYINSRLVETGRQFSLGNGETRIVSIQVVTPTHITKYYYITFTRSKSTNADLASLSATFNNYTILPAFDKSIGKYLLILPTSRNHVVVTAKAESGYAIMSINGKIAKSRNITLKKGTNTVTIIVKAQAGNMKVYTITIIRGTAG